MSQNIMKMITCKTQSATYKQYGESGVCKCAYTTQLKLGNVKISNKYLLEISRENSKGGGSVITPVVEGVGF